MGTQLVPVEIEHIHLKVHWAISCIVWQVFENMVYISLATSQVFESSWTIL